MKTVPSAVLAVLACTALLAGPASAHTGEHALSGLADGFLHPLTGPDHLLAMLAVGLWSGRQRGPSMWMWPAAFLLSLAAGAFVGAQGATVPGVEIAILGSVVMLGGLAVGGLRVRPEVGTGVVALLALAHGHAHGAEMPAQAGFFGYPAGFLAATALLHLVGLAATLPTVRGALGGRRRRDPRPAGAASTGVGPAAIG